MDQPTNTPIATRTRLQKPTTQQLTAKESSSTERCETNENFSKLNINDDKEEKNMVEEDSKIFSSLSTVTSKENEISDEQFNNISHSNLQLQLLQESFTAELEKKQKIIDEQQQLLLQLQSNIQALMIDKHHQHQREQYQEPPTQTITFTNSNLHPISGLITVPQREPSTDSKMENNIFKYDNFIEQQLLKDKISNIKKFPGNKYDDVDEWLENIEHDFSSTLVSEEIKLKLVPKSLTDNAECWFRQNKHRLTSWKIFKTEIQHRFQSSLHKDEKFIRLRERKQQLKETGQQFIDAMEKLCFQVNPSMLEQEKMLHIKAGLRTSLKEKVLDKQPQSMEELRNTVKRIEDIETMLDNGNNNNEDQMKQPSSSSNFEQQPFSSDFTQPTQYNSDCYAVSSYGHNSNHRRNDYRYDHHQQPQQMDPQSYQSDDNYRAKRNRHDDRWNQQRSNQRTRAGTYSTSSTNNHSKKY